MNSPLFRFAAAAYQGIINFCAAWLQPVFLLLIRLYWGWQFHISGMGKLANIPKVSGFFQSLGIPYPTLNAYVAGCTECFGGLFLLLGLASRITTLPLIFTMIVAYLTASPDAVKHIFSKPDDFTGDAAFLFLFASLIVFIFGPGPLSLDGLIDRVIKGRAARQTGAAAIVP